eukprot:1465364-Amphidinium_carterae.1
MELKHQEEAQASLKVSHSPGELRRGVSGALSTGKVNTSQKSLMKLSAALETLQVGPVFSH